VEDQEEMLYGLLISVITVDLEGPRRSLQMFETWVNSILEKM